MHQLLKIWISDKNIEKNTMPDVKRAARYYYLVKCSFNNNPQSSFSKNSSDWNTELFIKDLEISRHYLENVVVENLDFRVLVDKYSPREYDLWYLDPPYMIATKRRDYYIHTLEDVDHLELLDICNIINKAGGKFMLSYDDDKKVHELYKEYNIEKIPVIYAGQTSRREYKNELVISNYTQPAIQEKLFDGELI